MTRKDEAELQRQEVAFYVRCQKVARAKGYGQAVAEDFPAWAYERLRAGSRATIDQMLIDYLRLTFGVTGTNAQRVRAAVNGACINTVAYEEAACGLSSPAEVLEEAELWSMVSGQDGEILRLYYQEGLSKREIGERYGVSEVAICKRMKKALAWLKEALEAG